MSFLLYTRWPDFDFCGARFGNSVSQNRRTNGSISTILQTSPMRKKSLLGISAIKDERENLLWEFCASLCLFPQCCAAVFTRCLIIMGVPVNGNRSRIRFSMKRSNEKCSFLTLFENITKVGGLTLTW